MGQAQAFDDFVSRHNKSERGATQNMVDNRLVFKAGWDARHKHTEKLDASATSIREAAFLFLEAIVYETDDHNDRVDVIRFGNRLNKLLGEPLPMMDINSSVTAVDPYDLKLSSAHPLIRERSVMIKTHRDNIGRMQKRINELEDELHKVKVELDRNDL